MKRCVKKTLKIGAVGIAISSGHALRKVQVNILYAMARRYSWSVTHGRKGESSELSKRWKMKIYDKPTFECEFCGKVSKKKPAMIAHEKSCKKNPCNICLCYSCRHFQHEHEQYKAVVYGEYPYTADAEKYFDKHKCGHSGELLYNSLHMWEGWQEALSNDGWVPMPKMSEGCEHYKKEEESSWM